jgi:hypothetical protein
MFLLVFIVWWTMFHGRPQDQPPARKQAPEIEKAPENKD